MTTSSTIPSIDALDRTSFTLPDLHIVRIVTRNQRSLLQASSITLHRVEEVVNSQGTREEWLPTRVSRRMMRAPQSLRLKARTLRLIVQRPANDSYAATEDVENSVEPTGKSPLSKLHVNIHSLSADLVGTIYYLNGHRLYMTP